MVLDKSIETLEDLVRFLNRKQSFYFKLYDRYLEGDYDRLDDSRKHEADCNAVCDDIVECIKAISDEAQIRGIAKKVKVLCALDGRGEEKYILDEWLLKVVRLLDDEANWNRMLAPVEGKDMNDAFDAILFRLTYVANFLKKLSNKTEQEYYGGRSTDVMPYYIGESKFSKSKKRLKELTQDEFNRLARRRDEFRAHRAQTDISPAEKNNLYADIKDFEEEFRDLQDTAERLPDSYIDQVCSTSSYPFDVAIDEVQNVEDWCSEAEEFLKDDINNWGIMKESKKRFKEAVDDFPKNTRAMYRFAKQKHDTTGAIRKHSGDPYWVHPEGVAKVAVAYGGTDIEIQAAMAHDTLEDTNCSYDELEEMFGDEVASIVREITNDTEEVDRLGKEQYINLELINLSHPALFVKLCDMYYNQMDFPTEAQKRRMIKNINYLLANREDDLNENEIALIEDILQTLIY